MWTSTLDLSLNRVLLTRLLGLVYPDVYYSSLSPLRVANIPRPALPSANWVRIRNRLAGICGSDLHLVYADADTRISVATVPDYRHSYPGHEVVGEVIEIGEEVQHLSVGDRVVLQYIPNCLSTGAQPVCRACTSGNYNLCEYGTLPGPQPIGGGWSEEMLLHEQQLFRLPAELSDEQGVMLEPTAVALHAVLRHLPQPDDNILIVGAGTIGLLTLQVLRTLIPKARISISARYPFQIEQATRLGADNIIYSADPYASVQRATQSRLYKGMLNNRTLIGGYDVIYETVGQQKTLHHALRWLRSQGTMVMVGLSLHLMNIDLTPIWHQETNLLGSLSHGREMWPQGASTDPTERSTRRSTFSIVTELIEQKRLQPEQLITHRFALNNYKDALKAASRKKSNQSVKVLFDYSLLPASAVPNVRASARPHRPVLFQPQGDAFMEEFVKSQNAVLPHQDLEPERVLQPNNAQQTIPPKILDTPPPPALTRESWRTILNEQDISPNDADDDDTATAIPVVKRLPYNPRASSKFTEPPQTPMPIAKGQDSDEITSANQASIPTMHQNWQINLRKPGEKQAYISATPKTEIPTDISEQQQSADATVRFSRPTFKPNDVPVTSLPIEPVPELIVETPEAQIEEREEISVSVQPTLEPQQVEESGNSELPEDVQDAEPSEVVFALPVPDTQSTTETESIDGNDATQPDDVPVSTATNPDTIISEPAQPTIDQAQKEELTEEEPVIASINLDEQEHLPDFLRYLQPFDPTPTYTLPSEVEQLSFPPSTDHTVLKLSANDGEHTSPFSETVNMSALTEEQLPTLNFLDNLFDTDTSSMPAFLEQLSNFGAPIVPEKPIEDAEAPTLPDLTSPDAPTLPDLGSPHVPILLDTSAVALPDVLSLLDTATFSSSGTSISLTTSPTTSSDVPTSLDAPAITPSDTPTLLDESAVTPIPDASEQVAAILAPRMPKAKKKQKTSKLAEDSQTLNSNVQHDHKQTEEASTQEDLYSQVATLTAQEQAAPDTNGKAE